MNNIWSLPHCLINTSVCITRQEVGNKRRANEWLSVFVYVLVHVCVCLCLGVWYKHFSVFLLQTQAVYTLGWVCLCLGLCVCRQAYCWIYENFCLLTWEAGWRGWSGVGWVSVEQKTLAPNRMRVCASRQWCVGMCVTSHLFSPQRMCILSACGLSCRDTDADSDAGVDVSLPTPPPICCLTSLNYWGSFGVTSTFIMKVFGVLGVLHLPSSF